MTALLSRVPVSLRSFVRLLLWTVLAWLVHEALAWLLVEVGLVARLLSPAPGAATFAALAAAAVFYALRLTLVFVAPPVLVASFARGIAALLAGGDEDEAASPGDDRAAARAARGPRPPRPPPAGV